MESVACGREDACHRRCADEVRALASRVETSSGVEVASRLQFRVRSKRGRWKQQDKGQRAPVRACDGDIHCLILVIGCDTSSVFTCSPCFLQCWHSKPWRRRHWLLRSSAQVRRIDGICGEPLPEACQPQVFNWPRRRMKGSVLLV